MKKLLVIAVHPDDETLGCGGTMLRLENEGYEIHWCIVTSISEENGFKNEKVNSRQIEIQEAAKLYNAQIHELNVATMKVDVLSFSKLIEKFSSLINKIKPEILISPYLYDIHSDHRKVFEAIQSCTKSFRYPFIKKTLMMEVLSETEYSPAINGYTFTPNLFIDITEFMDEKLKIMSIFESEIDEPPFPRSLKNIRALGTLRGSQSNSLYAEAFVILKEII